MKTNELIEMVKANKSLINFKVYYELEYYDEDQKNFRPSNIKSDTYNPSYFYEIMRNVNRVGNTNEGKDYTRFRVVERIHLNVNISVTNLK